MIMSGWILPDAHEIRCKSCSTINGHISIVQRYLSNLKFRDMSLHNKITDEFVKIVSGNLVIGLDDFAVIKLGWIKVIDRPIRIIFYTKDNPLYFIIQKYENIGFSSVVLEESKPSINVHIPSKELI